MSRYFGIITAVLGLLSLTLAVQTPSQPATPATTAASVDKMPSYTEHTLTHGGNLTLAYLDGGPHDAPLLIFMHGWPGIAITWQHQLDHFVSKGFRVLAPDMPGYGNSSTRHVYEDYSVENTGKAMLALLSHVNRTEAVWVAHDWGTGTLWGLASHHPEVVRAAAGLAVPYHSLELGLIEELKYVNRTIYPEERYPYGQWSYQKYYELSFENVTDWFNKDPAGFLKALIVKGNPDNIYKVANTADVVRDGGWFGGIPQPPTVDQTPDNATVLTGHIADALNAAMEKTGFWGAGAWYMNHRRNRAYALNKWVNNGVLDMPVLFIEAKYDNVCATASSDDTLGQAENTRDLTYVSVDSGHWLPIEKPDEVNKALENWLKAKVGDYWDAACKQ